jgi:replication factor C subunit 3/5
MLLCNKYAPENLNQITFHKDIVNRLLQMSKDNAIPHLILYGPDGAGKKTIIRILLENIFDKSINNMNETTYIVNGSGNTTQDILIKQSAYHIVIEPNNNNFDRYLIQNVVKEYAKRIPIDIFQTYKSFKVVLINDVENLSYYAQMSLRRTMEKYSKTCRFIMICNSISKLIEPLRSRCLCIRVQSPKDHEIINTLLIICKKENYKLSLKNLSLILQNCKNNIKHAVWMLECFMRNLSLSNSFNNNINKIINMIMEKNINNIIDIRLLLYNIILTNISSNFIIQTIMGELCNHSIITQKQKNEIVKKSTKYDRNITLGRREIIHLDSFIVDIILTLMS